MGLLITLFLGLFFVVGAFFTKFSKNTKNVENLSISIALGTMSSLIIFDLFPEMFEHMEGESVVLIIILILCGVLVLKMLDIFVPEHDHNHSIHHNCSDENLLHIGIVSLVAIVLHNVIEGMAVYNIANESFKSGLLIALGVGLHNIPMGMIVASTLEHESNMYKLIALLFASLSTFFGGLIMFLISSMVSEFIIGILICVTLGMILYIVLFELIPHILHGQNKKLSIIGILIGVLVIVCSSFFE